MIQWLLCHLFGHKRVYKTFTGQYGQTYESLTGQQITVPIEVMTVSKFCLRCGKDLSKGRGE